MDMHSFLRRFEVLTGKTLSQAQAVEYISQYFTEAALTWWTNFLFNVREGLEGAASRKPSTETELYTALQKAFGDIHSVKRRREKYEAMKQTSLVQSFANDLKHCVLFLDPRPPKYEILRRFQNGLRPEIRAKIDKFHSDIRELDKYINKANDIDRTLFRLKQNECRRDREDTPRSDRASPEQGRSYAIGSPIPSRKRDPEGFKKWCRSNDACFGCSSKDHKLRDCSKKDSKASSEKATHP